MASGFVETNGVRLWFEELGRVEGAPVVLVSGGGASVVWWPPGLVQGLVGAGLRVVQFDNRDVGWSTHLDGDAAQYGIDDMAADTVGLLDALDIPAAHLVGISVGGMVCQVTALDFPDRVRSLTLLCTTPGPDPRLSPGDPAVFDGLDRPVETDEDAAEVEVDFCRAVAGSRFPFDERHHREMALADQARGTNRNPGMPSASSRVDDLDRIQAPTLVVHGTEDPIYPYDHATTLARRIPRATLVTWDGVGHELPPPLLPGLTSRIATHVTAATSG
jgi:pimeloyl-ACP methyl ester carboxylesterase